MGVVYQARQISLNRSVALKMLKSDVLASDDERRRFQNEAEAVALLDHPHIVPILEVGEHEGRRYFSMKLIAGASLDKTLGDRLDQPRSAATLVAAVAEAVHHAHQRGILHRDIKPSNILLDDKQEPYVTDFGLAKRVEGDSELTHSGAILGTPAYMAPEQASGRRGAVTTASDVYGLGAVLYACLTGKAPFGGESVMDTLQQVRERLADPPSRHNPKTPRDLDVIALKCLNKDPSRRYGTAQELADDLRNYLSGQPITARPVGKLERAWLWTRRNPAVASLIVLVVLSLLIGSFVSTRFGIQATRNAERADKLAEAERNESIRANAAARRAIEEKEWSERVRYAAEINAAVGDYRSGNIRLARERLAGLAPKKSTDLDYRGFEWNLLDSLFHSELRVIPEAATFGRSVAFSPDGRRIATAGPRGLRIFDSVTGGKIMEFLDEGMTSIAFNPDGKRFASCCSHGSLFLWDSETGELLFKGEGHKMAAMSVVFSPDGKLLATGGLDNTVRIWDATTCQEIRMIPVPGASALGVAFSPDGQFIASACFDENVRIWETATGKPATSRPAILSMKPSPVNAARSGGGFSIPFYMGIAFSPDGTLIASTALDGHVAWVWNAATGELKSLLLGHEEKLPSLAFTPDSRGIATASHDGTVRLWDSQSGREIAILRGHEYDAYAVAFSPDGRRLASVGDGLRIWDLSMIFGSDTLRSSLEDESRLAFSRDGQTIAIGGKTRIDVIDSVSGLLRTRAPTQPGEGSLGFSAEAEKFAILDTKDSVRFWNAATGWENPSLPIPGTTKNLRTNGELILSPDGRLLASAEEKVVRLRDTATGRVSRELQAHTDDISLLAFSKDGQRIASTSKDDTVRVWDITTYQTICTIPMKNSSGVRAMEFSQNGQILAVAENPDITLWEIPSGHQKARLQGHREVATLLRFSADGRRLFSVESISETSIRVWDVATGRGLLNFEDFVPTRVSITANSLELSPDGRSIAWSGHFTYGDEPNVMISSDYQLPQPIDDGSIPKQPRSRWVYSNNSPGMWTPGIWTLESRPLTPELRDRREALGLVRFHLNQATDEPDFLDQVSKDMTVSPTVRGYAQTLARGLWNDEQARREAARKSAEDQRIGEERAAAQARDLAKGTALNLESWDVVKLAGQSEAAYQTALRKAEEATRLMVDYGGVLNTLGVAQYRAGLVREALATLTRSNELNAGNLISDAIFAAMCRQKLGQTNQARAALDQIRQKSKNGQIQKLDQDDRLFLREAELLILDAEFPGSPF